MTENRLEEISKITKDFRSFLNENDRWYAFTITFNVSYNPSAKHYKMDIFPGVQGIDSQKYFMFHFETEEGQELLAQYEESRED